MPKFSTRSASKLSTCHPKLKQLFSLVVLHFDCSVICGHRDEDDQQEAFQTGHSQVEWPNSKHNAEPSQGIDVMPYPIDWADRERVTLFAGFVLGMAKQLGINVRWGGNWAQDFNVADNSFDDLAHFELIL